MTRIEVNSDFIEAVETASSQAELMQRLGNWPLKDKLDFCDEKELGYFHPDPMTLENCNKVDALCNEQIRRYWFSRLASEEAKLEALLPITRPTYQPQRPSLGRIVIITLAEGDLRAPKLLFYPAVVMNTDRCEVDQPLWLNVLFPNKVQHMYGIPHAPNDEPTPGHWHWPARGQG